MKHCFTDNLNGDKHSEPMYCQLCWNRMNDARTEVEKAALALIENIQKDGPAGGYRRSLAVSLELALENANRAMHGATLRDRETNAKKYNLKLCPRCGSGDVSFCEISRRPHCNECHYWPPPNFGTDAEAIAKWNAEAEKAGR